MGAAGARAARRAGGVAEELKPLLRGPVRQERSQDRSVRRGVGVELVQEANDAISLGWRQARRGREKKIRVVGPTGSAAILAATPGQGTGRTKPAGTADIARAGRTLPGGTTRYPSGRARSPCQGGDRGIGAPRARAAGGARKLAARSPSDVGQVAQLAEHAAENRGVGSSILPLATLHVSSGLRARGARPSAPAPTGTGRPSVGTPYRRAPRAHRGCLERCGRRPSRPT
jgi:hypothetical protein